MRAGVDAADREPEGGVGAHDTRVGLLAEWRAGEARAQDDAAAVAWIALDELPRYGLWDETVRVIHLAADRRGKRKGP